MQDALADAYLDGAAVAQDLAGLDAPFDLTDEQAIEYARRRAAELIGKRILDDGSIVNNPNRKWAVSDTVREQIREKVRTALAEGWAEKQLQEAIEDGPIWDTRSDAIARTEVAFAINRGAADSYEEAGVEKVKILDGPGCLQDGHDDTQRGVSGEVWTLEEWEEYPVAHPNCRRDAVPIVDGG